MSLRPFVLIIDGTSEEQLSIVENLEDTGYHAYGVKNPEQALTFCREVDIVLTSLQSIEQFGLASFRALQEKAPKLRFILTAPEDRIAHLDLPGLRIARTVPAPFLLRDLIRAVRRTSSPWYIIWRRFLTGGEKGAGC